MPDETIPLGLCQCGCGAKTRLATKTSTRDGAVKGQPKRFVSGHNTVRPAVDPEQRFWPKVKRTDLCWFWTAYVNVYGYGVFWNGERRLPAHRYAYELLLGSIPEGLQLDHLCRNRRCVNPNHLEVVSNRENVRRGDSPPGRRARQTHCIHGHPLSGENVFVRANGTRQCRACARYREAQRAKLNKPNPDSGAIDQPVLACPDVPNERKER